MSKGKPRHTKMLVTVIRRGQYTGRIMGTDVMTLDRYKKLAERYPDTWGKMEVKK